MIKRKKLNKSISPPATPQPHVEIDRRRYGPQSVQQLAADIERCAIMASNRRGTLSPEEQAAVSSLVMSLATLLY